MIGGQTGANAVTATTEIFDPKTNKTSPGPTMAAPRMKLAAILLPNAKVLIVGGQSDVQGLNALATTELFDTATATLAAGPSLSEARSGPSLALATQQGAAKVLISGGLANGISSRTAELYDVATDKISSVASTMVETRYGASAVTLASGTAVLIQGGYSMQASGPRPASSEVFDATTGNFTPTPSVVTRAESTLVAVGSHCFALGGTDGINTLASAEQFDGKAWSLATASLAVSRQGHGAAILGSKIFLAGGFETAPS